jgi:hypothetical protein
LNYFGGTASHNTVQFDKRDQMSRISRFLFGDWLTTRRVEPLQETADAMQFGAGYQDRQGSIHFRRIRLGDSHLRVEDEVSDFKDAAVLRWRLAPGQWHLDQTPSGPRVVRPGPVPVTLNVSSTVAIVRTEMVEGWESRHYLDKTPVPVLEIEIGQAGILTTDVRWSL